MSTKLRIGGATVNQTPIDWANNTANIIAAIGEALRDRIDILCFPEMCLCGYGCEDLFLAPWMPARAWAELLKIREACEGITIAVGLPIRHQETVYNGACVIRNKKILGITLKQNLARDGVHYEPRWFTAWPAGEVNTYRHEEQDIPLGDVVYDVGGIVFGFEICEDAWRKNRPGYRLHKRGVDLILNPSASHFALGKSTLREHEVVEEGSSRFACAYVFTNLLGNEAGRMIYDGDIIIGQHGKILAVNRRLSCRPYTLIAATVDFTHPDQSEVVPSHDGKERNEEFARAMSLALFDYLRKSKAKGFVLSLSGGADSSCCAVLVAEMVRRAGEDLGWENFCMALGVPPTADQHAAVGHLLTTAYQGTQHSSAATAQAARALAGSVGARFYQWYVDDEINDYRKTVESVLGRPLSWERDDIALQNIQARSRSPVIWLLANVERAILLTTSNRSEGDVGYATMDGDTSGSLAPLAGVDKVFLLQWLRWAETSLGYSGLQLVNQLQPTAELRPADRAQTDEKDLMPYTLLVELEKLAIRDRKSPVEIFQTLSAGYPDHRTLKANIRKFFTLWSATQWKRERLAPSFHVDDFNIDPRSWCRFPILSGGFSDELRALDDTP
jgi:NAD+ synthase (glutamine-hydrolysing)